MESIPIEFGSLATTIKGLDDEALEQRLSRLTGIERKALVLLLAHLGEFDGRRLYADRGQPSLFAYCVRVLGYSEQEAYKRIQAARAAKTYPVLLERLAAGRLSLTGIVILAPHLRQENIEEVLSASDGKATRALEVIAAELAPRPDSPDCIRALPPPNPPHPPVGTSPSDAEVGSDTPGALPLAAVNQDKRGTQTSPPSIGSREDIEPLSFQRILFRFTGSSELRRKYDRALGLGLGRAGGRSLEAAFEEALDTWLEKSDPERRHARRQGARRSIAVQEEAGKNRSRRIPVALRDQVWNRDGGRCTYAGKDGDRCPETKWLEIDHVIPFALGGSSNDPSNLRLSCRAHNQLWARRIFGERQARRRNDYPRG
ncbi:MAG: HNH endonuclease [Elusimicrobia bacterium]|nr:HNH endonuclease [Elusimicrobiota bacterium]